MMEENNIEEEDQQLVILYAYEEVPPRVKTKEEILAEQLAALKTFDFPPPDQPENDSTGKMAYLHACKLMDKTSFMKYPTTSIASDLEKLDSETLDLSFAGLGVKGCFALAAALRVNTSVSHLVLVGNSITPAGAMEIAKATLEARAISVLDLSVNALGSVDVNSAGGPPIRGGHVINELLGSTSPISTLLLRRNGLTDGDITLFSETLSENVMLMELDLSYNKISFLGAAELACVIARNADIHSLNLEYNPFSTPGVMQLLGEGLIRNNTIKMINLSGCGLDDTCVTLLTRIMSENAIEEIIVANNRMTKLGSVALVRGILAASSLTKFVLDGNPLGDEGCETLLEGVATLGEGSSFHYLSLLHTGCGKQTVRAGLAQSSDSLTILISEGSCKVGYDFD